MKSHPGAPPIRRILLASLIGTTIEFFDFYIYATAAVLVFPKLFFPGQDPATATVQSLATFALAFFARPDRIGVVRAFRRPRRPQGHPGDGTAHHGYVDGAHRFVADLCVDRLAAPALLALCRFGQGLGLGGEWGGAVLLATENAPPGKLAWYGSFPQLGAPLGFLCSNGAFLCISTRLSLRSSSVGAGAYPSWPAPRWCWSGCTCACNSWRRRHSGQRRTGRTGAGAVPRGVGAVSARAGLGHLRRGEHSS